MRHVAAGNNLPVHRKLPSAPPSITPFPVPSSKSLLALSPSTGFRLFVPPFPSNLRRQRLPHRAVYLVVYLDVCLAVYLAIALRGTGSEDHEGPCTSCSKEKADRSDISMEEREAEGQRSLFSRLDRRSVIVVSRVPSSRKFYSICYSSLSVLFYYNSSLSRYEVY